MSTFQVARKTKVTKSDHHNAGTGGHKRPSITPTLPEAAGGLTIHVVDELL